MKYIVIISLFITLLLGISSCEDSFGIDDYNQKIIEGDTGSTKEPVKVIIYDTIAYYLDTIGVYIDTTYITIADTITVQDTTFLWKDDLTGNISSYSWLESFVDTNDSTSNNLGIFSFSNQTFTVDYESIFPKLSINITGFNRASSQQGTFDLVNYVVTNFSVEADDIFLIENTIYELNNPAAGLNSSITFVSQISNFTFSTVDSPLKLKIIDVALNKETLEVESCEILIYADKFPFGTVPYYFYYNMNFEIDF